MIINAFFHNKKLAASLSVLSNFILIVLKLITGFVTGSVSIISEAIHSGSDFLASIIALFAVHKAEEPADKDHPFGHGKYEDAAGFAEGCLIILASLYIIYEAGLRLTGSSEPLSNSTAGIAVMLVSVITNIAVSSYLFKVAKNTDSIALHSDAQHLCTDIYSSLTVLVGLVIIKYTGHHVIDSLIAVIVAMIIMHTGYRICKETLNDLLDGSLPQNDIDLIQYTIQNNNHNENICKIKDIKTRKSGKNKDIVITLIVDGSMTVAQAHKLCDKLECEIENALGNTKIIIHVEPQAEHNLSCQNNDI